MILYFNKRLAKFTMILKQISSKRSLSLYITSENEKQLVNTTPGSLASIQISIIKLFLIQSPDKSSDRHFYITQS